MAIIVNTNVTALRMRSSLNNATTSLNNSLLRMSTGYKINSAKDDAAGLYLATNLNVQISGSQVAKDNIATGTNVLQTIEGDLDVMMDNLYRIRDLSLQAANGIYDATALEAMEDEATARLDEIDRISAASNFNGLKLLDGTGLTNGLRLQVGANSDPDANAITIEAAVFAKIDSTTLGSTGTKLRAGVTTAFSDAEEAAEYVDAIDEAIDMLNTRKATIGATQNRLDAANASLTTTIENTSAAHSTIMDADIAEEAAEYTKQQILQQTSSTLLVQANQLPALALTLIQ